MTELTAAENAVPASQWAVLEPKQGAVGQGGGLVDVGSAVGQGDLSGLFQP